MTSHLHFPKLKYSPLKNLIAIREEAKKELDEILKTHEGDKTIVLDPALTRPVSYTKKCRDVVVFLIFFAADGTTFSCSHSELPLRWIVLIVWPVTLPRFPSINVL